MRKGHLQRGVFDFMSESDSGVIAESKGLSLGTRCILAALFILVLALIQNFAGHKPSDQQILYQSECHIAKIRYQTILIDVPDALTSVENTDEIKREKKGREQVKYWCALLAQQTDADAARYTAIQSLWITVLTGIGILLIGGTLIFTAKTLKEAESATTAAIDTTNVTLEIGKNQSRAYINVVCARIYQIDPGRISIKIKNSGETPAKSFGLICEVQRFPNYPDGWFDQIDLDGRRVTFWTALGSEETTSIAEIPHIGHLTVHPYGAVAIKGAIVYRTIYDEDYFSEFAFVMPPGLTFNESDTAFIDGKEERVAYADMLRPSTKRPLRAYQPVQVKMPN